MNDSQLTDLFRKQLPDETQIAPGFDELWSQAATRYRSARIRKFAAIGIAIACVTTAVFTLVTKEKAPSRADQIVAGMPPPQPAEPTAELRASAVPQPYRFQSESDADRLSKIHAHIRFLRRKNEADQKRATVLRALNQKDQAARLNEEIAARTTEIADETGIATKLATTVDANPVAETGDPILPGDSVEVSVKEDAGFNGRYLVRRGGYIIMPEIGKVSLAGKNVEQAAKDLRANLMKNRTASAFTVEVKRAPAIRDDTGSVIYLSGEFRNPRPYRIPEGTTPSVISVLLSSGGWTDRADITKVKILRLSTAEPTTETFNARKVLEGPLANPASADTPMLSEGDVIVLPASTESQLVYVTGSVKRSGSYRISDGEKLSVYGSILQSGGITPGNGQLQVFVLRKSRDGTAQKIPVNLERIKDAKTPDLQLMSGDVVLVARLAR